MKLRAVPSGLILRRDLVASGEFLAAHERLVCEVLGRASPARGVTWKAIAFFSPDGQCAAALEVGLLPLVLDGETKSAAAIRAVATHPDWRNRGLFHALMDEALDWCDAASPAATLLYTETPALYERFGFHALPQHAFLGPPPEPTSGRKARRLACSDPHDMARVRDLLAVRGPVSRTCALVVDAPLFIANLVEDDALRLAYAEGIQALIVFEQAADELVILDVVAATTPSLSAIVGAIGCQVRRVRCLFRPDRLEWGGTPVLEDTGLMIRGATPHAMRTPFMFPPTCEF